jgi:hypothetical protein
MQQAVERADLSPELRTEVLLALDAARLPRTPLDLVAEPGGDLLPHAEIDRAEMRQVARAAGLGDRAVERLLAQVPGLASLDDTVIEGLVRQGILDKSAARALGVGATVHEVGDGSDELVAAVLAAELPEDRGGRAASPRDLAALDATAWRRVLDQGEVTPPDGLSRAGYAASLADRVARLFPTDAVRARLPRAGRDLEGALERLEPLQDRNERVAGADFDALDIGGLKPRQVRALREAHAQVAAVARSHAGLGLAELLDDRSAPTDERVARVRQRVALLDRVRELNPDTELLALDLTTGSVDQRALRLDGIAVEDRPAVLQALRAQQRMLAVSGDADTAAALLTAGYSSAVSVAQAGPRVVAEKAGLEHAQAEAVSTAALDTLADVTGVFGGVLDATHGGLDTLEVGNVRTSVQDYLRRLPGYADLFGSQASCSCRHCDSVLSPAAYFVDLMSFVENHVTTPVFGARPDHVLHLRVRRPDLWTTPLTCANTEQTVPTLEIVCEVLESYLATATGYAGALTDRAAVQDHVYAVLAQSVESFDEPFVLPLARLAAYLAHEELSLGEVARTLAAPPQVVTAATLGVSESGRWLIATRNVSTSVLSAVYGLDLPSGTDEMDPVDAQQLLPPLSVTRQQLGQVLRTRFVAAGGASVLVTPEKTDPSSVQNDIERVHGLTRDALDRIHRFTRLWRQLACGVGELDLLLTSLGSAALTANELDRVAVLRTLAYRLGVSLEEVCALTGEVPRERIDEATPALFDRLFNPPPFVVAGGPLPQDGVRFVHPALRDPGSAPLGDPTVHRLQAALGVGDEELQQLLAALAPALGSDPTAATQAARGFTLSATHLSLLYRHARVAQLLHLGVGDLFRLVALIPRRGPGWIADADDLVAVLDLADWRAESGYSLDDLAVVRHAAPADPTGYADPVAVADALVADVAEERALTFADTVFAFLPGVTEEASRALVAENPARLLAVPGGYRLADGFRLDEPLSVPAGVTVDDDAVLAALAPYHPAVLLPRRLAGTLRVPADKVAALLGLLGADLAGGGVAAALHGGPAAPVRALLADLVPLQVAFQATAWDAAAVAFVAARPGLFHVANPRDLPIAALQSLSAYAGLAVRSGDAAETPLGTAGRHLRAALETFDPRTKLTAPGMDALASVLGVEPGLVRTVGAALTLPDEAVAAVQRLAAGVGLARRLGVSGDALAALLSDDMGELQRAADAVLGALRARIPEPEWPARLDPLEDGVRERRRDALVDHLLHSTFPQFRRPADLYDHFLLDVELSGCARTSRVVAAVSTLQLYVHRVVTNLEQDQRDPRDPDHVHVDPARIPAGEWEWRRSYRVWEANRKVFLWPENYLEPTLRDDKTPLFEALESTLLQSSVDEQHVLDAYAEYLAGFDELAALRIGGSFHEKDAVAKQDVLHLVGVTSTDPPVFYHRPVRNAHYGVTEPGRGTVWAPWRKIDVQVGGRTLAPVVAEGRLHAFWLEHVTKAKNRVQDGGSKFVGYDHLTTLRFTTLRLDGRWTAPQRIPLSWLGYFVGDGVLQDWLSSGTPRYDTIVHNEPHEGYTLRGFPWDSPYPAVTEDGDLTVTLVGCSVHATVDLFDRALRWRPPGAATMSGAVRMPRALPAGEDGLRELRSYLAWWAESYEDASYRVDPVRVARAAGLSPGIFEASWLTPDPVVSFDAAASVEVVNGSISDVILDDRGDLLLVQGSVRPAPRYLLRRLGTTLGRQLSRLLFTGGVDTLLALPTQRSLGEAPLPVTLSENVTGDGAAGRLDHTGAFGTYYQEVFHHIPELLATHLSGQQRFGAARQWFHRLFDPTAAETLGGGGGATEPGATAWQSRSGVGIYCDVDTSSAGLRETPIYLVSIGGATNQWDLLGAAAVHAAGPTSFRVYLRRPQGAQPTPQEANDSAWTVQWVAVPRGRRCGSTIPGHTAWQDETGVQGIYCDVDTSSAGLSATPVYLTSIAGTAYHGEVTGAAAVSSPTATGFRVHLRRPQGTQPTPQEANDNGWVVQWLAVPTGPAADSTLAGSTAWQDFHGTGVYCDVDTSSAGLPTTPLYLVSVGGDGGHWDLTGTSCVYNATPTGFRCYVRRPEGEPPPTPDEATGGKWVVQWTTTAHVVDEMVDQQRRDRPWRYLRFRDLDIVKLRETLTDEAALEAYRTDPFNPHAIARLRVSAYQKSLVMRYVDNLLDWADTLFSQFTTESVNEATMLYVTAAGILGDRPAQLGDCGETEAAPRTYETVAPLVANGSEFLVELESTVRSPVMGKRMSKKKAAPAYVVHRGLVARAKAETDAKLAGVVLRKTHALTTAGTQPALSVLATTQTGTATPGLAAAAVALDTGIAPAALAGTAQGTGVSKVHTWHLEHSGATAAAHLAGNKTGHGIAAPDRIVGAADHARAVVESAAAFCIPVNPELLTRWNRVEDRLTKIRHCRDINGVPRLLELFAPEIEPRLLVRARAAGLSLDDVLSATAGNLPPYRFSYLIDRAKAHAALVQSFGAALLSALEKKDVEELNRLRLVQQQNLLRLTTQVRQWEIDAATDAIETLERQREAVAFRRDHLRGLVDAGLTGWERTQQVARHTATGLQTAAGVIDVVAGIAYLVPQLGSPFAMKYGGMEVGNSANAWAMVLRDAAGVADAVAWSAGLEATFQRRKQSWEHDAAAAEKELAVFDKQLEAARIRFDIAVRAQRIHEDSLAQVDEMFDYYSGKFSSLGLYTWLSSTLQRVYRQAYNGAFAMARLAEQAYRFERGDETSELLAASYWDASHVGLLTGERLQADLHQLERRFLETGYRSLEIDQPFALTQVNPAALVALREQGECTFGLPEVFFDLAYPGHYRRKIKSVRLTVPCVTGPYTNVSATLTLLGSLLRNEPQAGAAGLKAVPLRRSVSIATSTAQQDAGVFELSFRDERYMPFEGAGAVSTWRLTLPKAFPAFDYRTITDVILHVTYTAEADDLLRERVEAADAALEGAIRNYLTNSSLVRVYSLRHEQSAVFQRLLHHPLGTSVPLHLEQRSLPLFLQGMALRASAAKLVLAPAAGQAVTGVKIKVNQQELSGFSADATLGGLASMEATAAIGPAFLREHVLTVTAPGALAPADPVAGDLSALDEGKLEDILVYVEYRLA